MQNWIKTSIIVLLLCNTNPAKCQDDLMNLIEYQPEAADKVVATFKGTRIISAQSVETRGEGTLDIVFMHRFGTLNSGAYNLWGLDDAWIRLGVEYAIWNDVTVGLGTFTTTAFSSMAINTLKPANEAQEIEFASRVSYTWQLMFARKFNPGFSLQISPTLVHHNLVETAIENNDIFALGFGLRQKITSRMALSMEYFYQFNNTTSDVNHNPLGLGLEIETGGHIFQLVFANSQAMIENEYITDTSGNFFDGDIHFGFNITRAFQLKKPKSMGKW